MYCGGNHSMSTNGKGSKRRPETKAGTFIRNWDSINWGKKDTHRPRPSTEDFIASDLKEWSLKPDAMATMSADPKKEEYHPPLD